MLEAATNIAASAAESSVSTDETSTQIEDRLRRRPDLDEAILDMKEHHYGYKGNLQAMNTSDEAFNELLDRIVPLQEERD